MTGTSPAGTGQPGPIPLFGTSFLYPLLFLSGVAGLGYEIVWTRMLAAGLGHEIVSLLAVVAAFFGGLALGAWLLDGPVSRSRAPGKWYAALEVTVGLWALATTLLLPAVNRGVHGLLGPAPGAGRHWLTAFGVTFLALLPATAAMGGTLPAMDRFFSRLRKNGRSVGGLYAANTAGAVAGTLGATFLLVPWLGFRGTLLALALLNLFCAAGVLRVSRGERVRPEALFEMKDAPGLRRLTLTLAATGFLGIGYEVLGVRVMAQALENTVYSFASALSVYLLGTAAGAALYQGMGPQLGGERSVPGRFLSLAFPALAFSCLLGVAALSRSDPLYESVRSTMGKTLAGSIAGEMALAASVFLLPSVLMGAVFSHLAQASRMKGCGVGRALGVNTLGGALAPLVFGVFLLPVLGSRTSFIVAALGYLLLLSDRRRATLVATLVPLALLPALPRNLNLVKPPEGGRLVAYEEGVMASVAVVEEASGNRLLKVNDRFRMGGLEAAFGERRMGHIPLLLHPDPRRALFLGLGTGITFGACADYPGLRSEGVELIPEVVDVLPFFSPANRDPADHDGLRVLVADARRYVQSAEGSYDVIVADLFHPARDGAGSLYTREHFGAIRDRLSDGGLFCQWLPLHQLDFELLRLILRTFLDVFPDAQAYLAHFNAETPSLGLVGARAPLSFPPRWFETRVASPRLAAELERDGLSSGFSLFGCFVAGPRELRGLAGDGPVNTDNRPLVTFQAPRVTYGAPHPTYDVLLRLLDAVERDASSLPVSGGAVSGPRLLANLEARDTYVRGDMARVAGDLSGAVDLYVESVRLSPDFQTGYEISLLMARRIAAADPARARGILEALMEANPSRPEARRLLRQAFGR